MPLSIAWQVQRIADSCVCMRIFCPHDTSLAPTPYRKNRHQIRNQDTNGTASVCCSMEYSSKQACQWCGICSNTGNLYYNTGQHKDKTYEGPVAPAQHHLWTQWIIEYNPMTPFHTWHELKLISVGSLLQRNALLQIRKESQAPFSRFYKFSRITLSRSLSSCNRRTSCWLLARFHTCSWWSCATLIHCTFLNWKQNRLITSVPSFHLTGDSNSDIPYPQDTLTSLEVTSHVLNRRPSSKSAILAWQSQYLHCKLFCWRNIQLICFLRQNSTDELVKKAVGGISLKCKFGCLPTTS